jgi:hypothetical protein
LKVTWRFGGTCFLHHQGWRISQARNQHEAGSRQYSLTFNGLHSITTQKIELFMNHYCHTNLPIVMLTCQTCFKCVNRLPVPSVMNSNVLAYCEWNFDYPVFNLNPSFSSWTLRNISNVPSEFQQIYSQRYINGYEIWTIMSDWHMQLRKVAIQLFGLACSSVRRY